MVDNPLSLNRYTFVHNNPLVNFDPTGYWCVSESGREAHAGLCLKDTSTWSPDILHIGDWVLEGGEKKKRW
ncbi:hypothetical protein V1503_23780 [Bacillus sp. SCS-151]|uniref:hypothetical protein n=1 Tax=Nanhaiella sioensis TaxID=3115293 RepID=UPI00397D0150